jgi:hypothetical protein
MIFVYSLEPQECDISGTKAELLSLATHFYEGKGLVHGEKEVDPYPYSNLGECLEIDNLPGSLVNSIVIFWLDRLCCYTRSRFQRLDYLLLRQLLKLGIRVDKCRRRNLCGATTSACSFDLCLL